MNESRYIDEVKNLFESCKTQLNLNKLNNKVSEGPCDEKFIHCYSPNEDRDVYIREGNNVYAIAAKENETWVIKHILCVRCSVQNTIEKISIDNPVAILEGELKSEKNGVGGFYIDNTKIWDVVDLYISN